MFIKHELWTATVYYGPNQFRRIVSVIDYCNFHVTLLASYPSKIIVSKTALTVVSYNLRISININVWSFRKGQKTSLRFWALFSPIRLHYPINGVRDPKYKLLHFIQLTFFLKKRELAFNRDRCCHLVLCLRLILFLSRVITN